MLSRIGNYEYYETPDNEDIFYVNLHRCASFFIKRDKTIIHGSRYYSYPCSESEDFVRLSKNIVDNVTEQDIENAIFIGDKIISICKWFVTYGHFMDEAFALCDFQNQFQDKSSKILLDYHTDNMVIKNYPVYSNYTIIDNLLFGNTSINAYSYGLQILKMKKLYLIKHAITDPMFHAFPTHPRNKILSKFSILSCKSLGITQFRPVFKLFITRGIAKHMNRNLDNESEISNYLIINNYNIINPEDVSFEKFIRILHRASHIVMTWGGALTNMCYCARNTNIIILKSKSYEHEELLLFDKIIKTYHLKVNVVLHRDNKINIPFL
jgi:hypothetical protein